MPKGGLEPAKTNLESMTYNHTLTILWSGMGMEGRSLVSILVSIFCNPSVDLWRQKNATSLERVLAQVRQFDIDLGHFERWNPAKLFVINAGF
jgi:hypothetical protein